MKDHKTLVLYLYREDDQTKDNLSFFVENGIINSFHVDYVFIINDFKCTVQIPESINVSIIKKENSFDLNSYIVALKRYQLSDYEYFVFINSSCIGPILPVYVLTDWIKTFTDSLTEEVKLVAPIVEIPQDNFGSKAISNYKYLKEEDQSIPFLHTYMFATDAVGLKILLDYKVFTENEIDQHKLVHHYERLLSSCILNEGYSIKCLLKKFENVDLKLKENWDVTKWSRSKTRTCPEVPGNYDGIDVHPLELIFTKNIRRQHSFRSWRMAGISRTLKTCLKNYVKWSMT